MKISDVIIDMHQGINTVADKVEYLDSGIPIIQSKNFTKGYLDLEDVRYLGEEDEKKYIEKYNPHVGDILMANIGTIGKSFVISEEQRFLIAWNAFLIKPNAEKVKSDFLKFYFDYLASTHYFDGLLTGGTVKFINKKKIGDINIPDKSLAEQSEICNVLSQVEKVIIQRQQEMELLDDLIKARFVEMFGDPVLNPFSWEMKRFDEICENLDSRRKPISSGDRVEGIYPYYGASGIVDYVEDYIFDEDILLVSEDGANLLMRSTPIAFSVSGKVWVNNHAHVVRFDKMSLQKYVEIYFSLIDISDSITGSAQPKLNQAKLNAMMIPIPEDTLLDRYCDFLYQVDKSKVAVQKSLDETQQLFDSLMQQYFG